MGYITTYICDRCGFRTDDLDQINRIELVEYRRDGALVGTYKKVSKLVCEPCLEGINKYMKEGNK